MYYCKAGLFDNYSHTYSLFLSRGCERLLHFCLRDILHVKQQLVICTPKCLQSWSKQIFMNCIFLFMIFLKLKFIFLCFLNSKFWPTKEVNNMPAKQFLLKSNNHIFYICFDFLVVRDNFVKRYEILFDSFMHFNVCNCYLIFNFYFF